MPNNSYITTSMCAERLKLSDVVTKTVQANYAAKDAHDRAVKSNRDATALALGLISARQTELAAVSALRKHRKEHGC